MRASSSAQNRERNRNHRPTLTTKSHILALKRCDTHADSNFTWAFLHLVWIIWYSGQKRFLLKVSLTFLFLGSTFFYIYDRWLVIASVNGQFSRWQRRTYIRRGTWWRICWVDDFQPEGRGFDSSSNRHVGTLGNTMVVETHVKNPRIFRFFDFQVKIFTFFISSSVNLFELILFAIIS